MKTSEFVEKVEDLGFVADENDYAITIWYEYGRNKAQKAKIAWVNKVHELNFNIVGAGSNIENKHELARVLLEFGRTPVHSRMNRRKLKQNNEREGENV